MNGGNTGDPTHTLQSAPPSKIPSLVAGMRSGVRLYRVHNGQVDDGKFVALDPSPHDEDMP